MRSKINIHEKYQPLFGDSGRYYVLTGGRGSAKSFSVALRAVLLTYEPGQRILFTRYAKSSALVSIIPEFIEKINMLDAHDDFRISRDEIINLTTGSVIMFKGIRAASGNQTANLKSITGLTCFILDEAEELIDEDIFDKVDLSVRSVLAHNKVILILNPTTKEHWVYKRFFEGMGVDGGFNGQKEDVVYVHTTYKDNIENLGESFLFNVMQIKLKDPEKYEHKILGGWLEKADGVILTNWKRGRFVRLENTCFGQDYGYSIDPTVLVECSYDIENKKLYVRECFGQPGMSSSQIASMNLKHAKNNLIMADSADPRLVDEIRNRGCNIRKVKKKHQSILSGLEILRDCQIIVDPNSKELIKELNNYTWKENHANKPIDDYNDYIDAMRYAMTKLYTSKKSGKYVLR